MGKTRAGSVRRKGSWVRIDLFPGLTIWLTIRFALRTGAISVTVRRTHSSPFKSFSPKLSGSLSIIIELSRAFCCFCPNSQARKAQDAIHPDEVVEPLRDLIALTTKGLTDRILVQFEKDKIQSAITMFRLCPSASDYFTSFPDELHKTCRIRCFKNRADYKSMCYSSPVCYCSCQWTVPSGRFFLSESPKEQSKGRRSIESPDEAKCQVYLEGIVTGVVSDFMQQSLISLFITTGC